MVALLFSPPLTSLTEVALLACFAALPDLRERALCAFRQPLVIATLTLYAVISIGTLYGIGSWSDSLGMWFKWRKLLLLPLAAAIFDETHWKQRLALILIAVTTLCAVVSYVGFLLHVGIYKYPPGIVIRTAPTQGMIFAVSAFAAAVLLRSGRDLAPPGRWCLATTIALLVTNIIYVTPGRSGYIALMVLSTIFAFYMIRGRARYALVVFTPALVTALLVTSPVARDQFSQTLHEMSSYEQSTEPTLGGLRVVFWKDAIALIAERPWFGYGTGGYEEASRRKVAGRSGWRGQATVDPHNQFMKFAAEHGLLGLAVFFIFIASAFRQKPSFSYRILGLGVLMSWCATSLFSSHFATHSEGRFLALWCGAMLSQERGDSRLLAWFSAGGGCSTK